MDIIKVSANSRTSAVAGAIAGVFREHKHAEIQAIGAGAVNQALKALIVATGYLKGDGIEVVCVPEFVDVQIEDVVRTAIKLVVEPRPAASEPPAPDSADGTVEANSPELLKRTSYSEAALRQAALAECCQRAARPLRVRQGLHFLEGLNRRSIVFPRF